MQFPIARSSPNVLSAARAESEGAAAGNGRGRGDVSSSSPFGAFSGGRGDRGNYFWKQSQPFIFTAGAQGNPPPLPLHFSRTGGRRAARAALRRGTGRRRIGGAGGHGVPAAGLEGWERGTSGRGRRKGGWKTGGGSKGPHPLCRAGSVRQPGAGSLGGTQPPLPPGWVSGSPSHEVGLMLEKAGAGKPLGTAGQMDGRWDRQQGAWQLQKSWLLACPGKLAPPQGCCPGPAHTGIGESGARPQGRRHGLLPARSPQPFWPRLPSPSGTVAAPPGQAAPRSPSPCSPQMPADTYKSSRGKAHPAAPGPCCPPRAGTRAGTTHR